VQTGGEADIEKYSKRTVRVTPQHNEECRRLLRLMGVPVVEVCHLHFCTITENYVTCTYKMLLTVIRERRHRQKQKHSVHKCARRGW
jgi:hypothetical protein